MIQKLIPHIKWYLAVAIIVGLLTVPAIFRLAQPDTGASDLLAHAKIAHVLLEEGTWFSYSLWYTLFNLVTLGSTNPKIVLVAIVALLGGFTILKAWVVVWISQRNLHSYRLAAAIAVVLAVVMPIIDPNRPSAIYLGQISANVWHNSTNIMVAPFAIAASYAVIVFFQKTTYKQAWIVSLLIVLTTLSKPNFSLAFLPVIGIGVLILFARQRTKIMKAAFLLLIMFIPVVLVLIFQYVAVFDAEFIRKTTLSFAPFQVWSKYSANLSLSLFLSLAGPVLMLIALSARGRMSAAVVISWSTLIVAIAQLALFAEVFEDGTISYEGNWFWGSYTAITIVFLWTIIALLDDLKSEVTTSWDSVIRPITAVAISAHVFSGVYYLLTVVKSINAW